MGTPQAIASRRRSLLSSSTPSIAVNVTVAATSVSQANALTTSLTTMSAAQLKSDGLTDILSVAATTPVVVATGVVSGTTVVPTIAVSKRLFNAGVIALSVLSGSSLLVCLTRMIIIFAMPQGGQGAESGYA
jgi:hypothetical protein